MRNNKKVYTIDFSGVEHYLEMHYVIKTSLDFPDYYGCNWDAFWDCLTDMYGEPMCIEIKGLDVIKQKFGDSADMIVDILKEFKHFAPIFTKDIEIVIVSRNNRVHIV